MRSSKQQRELKALIDRADAVARLCKGETLKCVREIRRDLVDRLEGRDISRNAELRERLILETQRHINRLRKRLDAIMDAQLEYSAEKGYKGASALLSSMKGGVVNAEGQRVSVVKYSSDRMSVMMAAIKARGGSGMAATFTQNMEKHIVTALRNATVSAYREQAIAGMTQRELMQTIKDKWIAAAKNGENFQFVDSRNRVWNTDTYMMMNVRTNSMAMYNDALVDTITRTTGSDLVRISEDGGTDDDCEVCQTWQGRILSVTGATEGFPTVADAHSAGVFHPNCIHTLEPVSETFDAEQIKEQRGKYV